MSYDPTTKRTVTVPCCAEMPTITIMRSSNLYLEAPGSRGEVRFANTFRQTWKQIPFGSRRAIVKFWRMRCARFLITGGPSIRLVSEWEGRSGKARDSIGMCSLLGTRLYFHSPTVEHMPAWIVRELVAHELAHVYQCILLPSDSWWSSGEECEFWAYDIELSWGFDPYEALSWYGQNKSMLSSIYQSK